MNKKANVVREAPSQRRYYRLTVPLQIILQGQAHQAIDWSIGGVRIRDFNFPVARHDKLDARVAVSFGDFNINFDTQLKVSRFDSHTQELAAEFFALDEKHQAILKYFSESLIRGEMLPIGDTIKRIDIPVTPVSEKPDPAPDHAAPLHRRSLKTWAMSGGYLALGVLLAYYATNTLYTNLFKFRVDVATLTGTERVIRAPIAGVVDDVYYQTGERVTRGDPLLYVRNDKTLESIELAKIEVRRAQTDLKEKQQLLNAQLEKLNSYREFGTEKLNIAKTKTRALQEKVRLAVKRQARAAKLHLDGITSEENLDRTEEQLISLKADLEVAIAEEYMAAKAIKEISQGRFFTDDRLEGEVDALRSALEAARQRVSLEQDRLQILENRRHRLVINAPVDGKIISLYSSTQDTIETGDPLLRIESEGDRVIEAYLSPQELDKVDLGLQAKVLFSGKPHQLSADITDIERLASHETDRTNHSSPDDEAQRFIRIKLSFTHHDGDNSIAALPSGLPVTVEFSKHPLSDNFPLLAWIKDFFLPTGVASEKLANN